MTEDDEVFVARQEELENFRRTLDRTETEGSRVLFVTGEAGIGKTRLAREFKKREGNEIEFLEGKSYPDSSEPYLPFKEAFERYIEEDTPEQGFKALSVIPEGPPPEEKQMFDAQREATFFESTQEVKKRAEEKPLVIFLDDLQWADKASLELLHYMTANLEDTPVLFIAAYRFQEISRQDKLMDIKHRMGRQSLYEEIELGPLNRKATRKIVEGKTGTDVPEDFVDLIYDRSEGNPLFIQECMDQMLADGVVDPEKDEYPVSEEEVEVPNILNDLMARRVNQLGDETRRILQIGAVIGKDMAFSLLVEATDMDELDILEHVDNLRDMGIWEEGPDEETFTFTHNLEHLVVYDDMTQSIKKHLHSEVADDIRSLYEDELPSRYSDLAFHYERAGELSKSLEYYFKAGERAEEMYAQDNAVELYEKALDISEEGPESISRVNILYRLGEVSNVLGRFESSKDYFEDCLEELEDASSKFLPEDIESVPIFTQRVYRKIGKVYEQMGDFDEALDPIQMGLDSGPKDSLETAKLLCLQGWIYVRQAEYDKAKEAIKRGERIARDKGSMKDIGRARHTLGTISFKKGDHDKAIRLLKEAIEIREREEFTFDLIASYNNIAVVYQNKGDLDRSLEYYEKSLQICEKVGLRSSLGSLYTNIGLVYRDKGLLDKAEEYYEKGLDMSKKMGSKLDTESLYINLGEVYQDRGMLQNALDYYKKGYELAKEIEDKQGMAISLNNMGLVHRHRGEMEDAIEKHRRSHEIGEDIGDKSDQALSLNYLGNVYLEMGELEKARSYYNQSLEITGDTGEELSQIKNYCDLGEVNLEKSEFDEAEEMAQKALSKSNDIEAKRETGLARRVLGMIYREKEEYDRSQDEFEKAEELFESEDYEKGLARTWFERAKLFEKRGEKEDERIWLERSKDLFEENGMILWSERVSSEMES